MQRTLGPGPMVLQSLKGNVLELAISSRALKSNIPEKEPIWDIFKENLQLWLNAKYLESAHSELGMLFPYEYYRRKWEITLLQSPKNPKGTNYKQIHYNHHLDKKS